MNFIFTPKSYDDESLLSYLYRHAEINVYPIKWLFSELKLNPDNYSGYCYINNSLKIEDIKNISRTINLSFNQVNELTYNKYHFFKKRNHNHHIIAVKSSRYCPICLKEERYPRLYWDIKPIKICLKHRIYLNENCDKCGENITITEIINGVCRCGKKLGENRIRLCEVESLIEQQSEILRVLGISYINEKVIAHSDYNVKLLGSFYKLIGLLEKNESMLKRINYLLLLQQLIQTSPLRFWFPHPRA